MSSEQQKAYEWAKNQNYQSVAAQHAKILADLITSLKGDLARVTAERDAAVVRCKDCKHGHPDANAFEFDGVTPLIKCAYMTQPNRPHEFCSWGQHLGLQQAVGDDA